MKGKCIVFYNLKPRPIAGIPSEGMVMCVSNSDRSKIEILRPEDDTPLGTRINILGEALELNEVGFINQKSTKKFLEVLTTNDKGEPLYDNKLLEVNGKALKLSHPNGTIS